MGNKIIEEWQAQIACLEGAAELNPGNVSETLKAQAEGYAIAVRTFNELELDPFGTVESLERAYCNIVDANAYLQTAELTTIAATIAVCIATLRRANPREVTNEESPCDHPQ